MPGPEPKPKSTEPAARACCNWPSPRKEETSALRPTDFQMPCLTPNSSPAKGKDELIALPTRTFFRSCAQAGAGKPHAQTPDANRAKKLRRLVRILPSPHWVSGPQGASLLAGQICSLDGAKQAANSCENGRMRHHEET